MRRFLPACCLAVLLLHPEAGGWSANTHISTAELVRNDVIDDGSIDIREVTIAPDGAVTHRLLGKIALRPELVQAIREQKLEFHAGSCSADAYPDMYAGQSVIHPYVPGQPWRAIDWARQVLRCAREYGEAGSVERRKALAFAAGWLVHYAGDAFGHTHVNRYAGGAWDWGDMGIVLRHVAYESYINTKIPGAGDETRRRLDADPVFIRDALMLDERVWPSISTVSYMRALIDYHHAFENAVEAIDDVIDSMSGGGLFDGLGDWVDDLVGAATGLGLARAFCAEQADNSSRALMEWAETGTRVIRFVTEGKIPDALGAVSEWIGEWAPQLLLAVPNGAEEVAHYLGAPIDWIMDPVRDLMDQTLTYLWEHLIRSTFERIVNPLAFMREMFDESVIAEVDALMGVTADHPELDPDAFAPYHDTVVLGKLALLDNAGIKALSGLLGVEIPVLTSDDNLLFDCIESLDASNQLFLYPEFRLVSRPDLVEKVWRRLFLTPPMDRKASAIDPAHLLLWPMNGLSFGTPVPDPLAPDHRVIGYVLGSTGAEGLPARLPVYESAIPTAGPAGAWTGAVWGSFMPQATGRLFVHLAVRRGGGSEASEDPGVDVRLHVTQIPGTGGDGSAPGSAERTEAIEQLRKQIASLEQSLAGAGTPPEAKAWLEKMLTEAKQALAKLEAGGGTSFPGLTGEPYVYEPSIVNRLEEIWREAMADETDRIEATQLPGIGRVLGEDGEPLAGATVTILTREIFDTLRRTTGVPKVPLDTWLGTSYLMGRTNAEGKYLVMGLREGPYVIVASAPGRPKTERAIDVVYGGIHGLFLPDVILTGALDPVSAAVVPGAASSEPADFGQHAAEPRLTACFPSPGCRTARTGPDGVARLLVVFRPIAGFSAPLRLSVEGLPEGVTAGLPATPLGLYGPRTVEVAFRGSAADPARCVLVAEAGESVLELPFDLDLTTAGLEIAERTIALAPGETRIVRVGLSTPSGRGRGGIVRLSGLPPGASVKVLRVKPLPAAPELELVALTPEKLSLHRAGLRAEQGFPEVEAAGEPERKTPRQVLASAPEVLGRSALFLAPGGYAEVEVTAAPDLAAGDYELEITIRRGPVITGERLTLRIGR